MHALATRVPEWRDVYDCAIVGGGPAGLSAALLLGRCRRRVVVFDTGEYRNASSRGVHGFLTRDGMAPGDLLAEGLRQLEPYGVEYRRVRVTDAACTEFGFRLKLEGGDRVDCRKLLIATGVTDDLPAIEGIERFYGASVHHCPYCDAWEWRDGAVAVYGRGRAGHALALSLRQWTGDLVLCTDGPARLSGTEMALVRGRGIGVETRKLVRLEGEGRMLRRIVFDSGPPLERSAMFFTNGQRQRSALLDRLGCEMTGKGTARTRRHEQTNIPGLFVAGDASRDVQFVVVAAAEGAKAAVAVNAALSRMAVEQSRRDV